MNESQTQTNGDRCKSLWGAAIGRPHYNHQEHEGQHHFRNKCREQGIAARRVFSVTVGCKTCTQRKTCLTARNGVEDGCCCNSPGNLRDNVGDEGGAGEAFPGT